MMRSAPFDVLLAILGRREAPGLDDLREREWDALGETASWHGLMPLLWHRLQEHGATHLVPAAVRQRLAAAHTVDTLRAEARRHQLREVLTVLGAHDVPVAPLKGAFLAEHAYPSPAVRPMIDLDLLVPEARLPAASAALAELGYATAQDAAAAYPWHRHAAPLRRPGRLPVELHRAIEPCAPPFMLPLADVWARMRQVRAAGVPALALAPEDLVLHLATHMGHSHLLGWSLVSVCDVARWVERFGGATDWDMLVRRAIASGTRRFAYAALELARRALAADVPRDALLALRTAEDDAAVEHAARILGAPPALVMGAKSATNPRESAWTRGRRLARALIVTPAHRRRSPIRAAWEPDRPARRDGYGARWVAMARLALRPSARHAAIAQIAHVTQLRRWAAEGGASAPPKLTDLAHGPTVASIDTAAAPCARIVPARQSRWRARSRPVDTRPSRVTPPMKRLLDVAAATLGLAILLVPLLAIALFVRVRMGRPILHPAMRAGLHGRPFRMYKFRTMRNLVDERGMPLPDRDRVTPLGRLLRRTSLDELPELLNVVKGDMSLVGPRPLLVQYVPLYTPEQARRLAVRPGITGLAQVQGRNAVAWEARFAHDVWYVDHASLRLDLQILARTVRQVLRRDGVGADGDLDVPFFQGSQHA